MLLADAVERHATKRIAHLTSDTKSLRRTHPAMGLGLRARSLGRRVEHGAQASMENPDDLSAAGALIHPAVASTGASSVSVASGSPAARLWLGGK